MSYTSVRPSTRSGRTGADTARRGIGAWLAVGWLGFAVLPWSAIGGGGFFAWQWLGAYPWAPASAPALVLLFRHDRLWFVPLLIVLLMPLALLWRPAIDPD